VSLIFVEVPRDLPISHLLALILSIPKGNARVNNYVVSTFRFVDKYLVRDGCILFFYDNDF